MYAAGSIYGKESSKREKRWLNEKEYHFATVQFDEDAQKVVCPVCSCALQQKTKGSPFCSCGVKKAILDGMPNVRFSATHMNCYGDRSCASFDAVDVGIILEVYRA